MKKILQFGAGSIGRGFLGQLYTESGYEVVFLEALDEMVQQLNRDQQYRLKIVGTNARELTISPVRAVNVRDPDAVAEEFETATLLGTAVGARNLPGVASVIVAGMRHRADLGFDEPLDLVICENLPHAAHVMRGHLHHHSDADFQAYLDTHLGLVETVVTRMVPLVPPELAAQDPTVVLSEDFKRLPVNQTAFKGPWPEVEGMIFTDNLPAYHEQKLYTDNTCHALLAYQGYQKGHRYVWEAVNDTEVKQRVLAGLQEVSAGLVKKHQFSAEEQAQHVEEFLQRVANPELKDTIARLGRDPLRKLGPDERLVGAARLAEHYGKDIPDAMARGIAAAMFFDQDGDEEAQRLSHMRREQGIDTILRDVCQIEPDEPLGVAVRTHARSFSR